LCAKYLLDQAHSCFKLWVLSTLLHSAALEASSTDVNPRERVKQAKHIQEPQHHNNDDDRIQYRLNAAGHWNKTIHQPKQDTDDDQGNQNLYERHTFFLSILSGEIHRFVLESHDAVWRAELVDSLSSTNDSLSPSLGLAINVLFDFLRATLGRGDQAEGDGPSNKTVPLLQANPRLS
jgi:hypothetical protein